MTDNTPALAKRALSLDALRGFAILTMVLSGVVPYRTLPGWMYHAQTPPPSRMFDPSVPGITWVDLVFPFFLFALGAAIPLALSKRIEKGASWVYLLRTIAERTLLLVFFSIFLRHIRPHVINPDIYSNPTWSAWFLALLGFAVMFAIFLRSPETWKRNLSLGIKAFGWLGALLFCVLIRYPDGSRFSLQRSDIILIVLTNGFLFGSLAWLFTRDKLLLRLGLMGILIAIRLAHPVAGWVQTIWNYSPIPWIYKLYYLQYLLIIIPGTIVGDFFVDWMKKTEIAHSPGWSRGRLMGLVVLMVGFQVLMLVGLYARWLWQTTSLACVFCGIGFYLVKKPLTETERLLCKLFQWGVYWLILGLIFEPFEGGIKKDHPTLSYYFVTIGLAVFLLIAFEIIIDLFRQPRTLRLLIDNGQNPMIAYVGWANLLWPLLGLTHLYTYFEKITPGPWPGFGRALFYTLILAVFVSYCTRKKLYWRT